MDAGVAYVCAISGMATTVRAKVETSVPKKRPGVTHHERGIRRFFDAVLAALMRCAAHGKWSICAG